MDLQNIKQFYVPLSNYQLGNLIGSGTSANVFQAKNQITSEVVALKIFKSNFPDEASKKQFEREIQTMAFFDHPAILHLKGFSIPAQGTHETATIATEFMCNGSLLDMLFKENQNLSPPAWTPTKKLECLFAVACGMLYIHGNNGIHRDLKPANILLDSNFEARIADFGLSKIEKEDSMQSIIGGTPIWMAPELFEQIQYTNKVDVFAFAIILFQFFTGHLPYDGKKNPIQIAMLITSGDRPDIPSDVPYFWAKLISDCWEQDPNDRPTFEEIVYRMLVTNTIMLGVHLGEYKQYQKKFLQYLPPQLLASLNQPNSQPNPQINQASMPQLTQPNSQPNIQINQPNLPQMNNHQKNPFNNQYQHDNLVNQDNSNQQNKLSINNQDDPYQHNPFYNPQAMQIPQNPQDEETPLEDVHHHHHKKKRSTLKKRVCQGDIDAMYEYGMKLINKGRKNKAAKYIITAANSDQLSALPIAAAFYEEGEFVRQNYTQAAIYWKKAADSGNPEAMLKCGQILEKGIGVKQSHQKALTYYRKAAENNNIDALMELSALLMNDAKIIGQQNNVQNSFVQEALALYEKAGNLGNLDGYFEYGQIMENHDMKRAILYYEKASKSQHLKSIERLKAINKNKTNDLDKLIPSNKASSSPLMGSSEVLVQQDEKSLLQPQPRAPFQHNNIPQQDNIVVHHSHSENGIISTPFSPSLLAQNQIQPQSVQNQPRTSVGMINGVDLLALKGMADTGDPQACYQLGVLLMKSQSIVELQNSAVYLRKAADAGIVDAQFRCGVILEKGLGYPANPQKAVYFYKKAAENGHLDATYHFAVCLLNGVGVPTTDAENANRFLRVAADKGHAQSQVSLAYNYENGIGSPVNYQLAFHYYQLAATQNNGRALCSLGVLYQEGLGVQANPIMAAQCYQKSAMQDNTIGMYNYAVLLQEGIGVEKNVAEAARFYQMAGDRGSSDAQSNYAILLTSGAPGLPKDLIKAKKYAKMAAEQGNPTGQCVYAQLLLLIDNNRNEAIKFFKLAAEQGNKRALRKLSEMNIS